MEVPGRSFEPLDLVTACRFVFMFKPGSFDVEVPVGYYTQILGLGSHPSDVVFTSSKGVYSQELFDCRKGLVKVGRLGSLGVASWQ